MPTPEAYDVALSSRASRETRRLDRQTLARISKSIDGLAETLALPDVSKSKQLIGCGESVWATGESVTRLMTKHE